MTRDHMTRDGKIRFKVCCIASIQESQLAIRYGASAVGLVSAMPSGPGVIDDDLITEIARTTPPGVASFLLTSATDAGTIIHQQRRAGVNTLQLCDRVCHPGVYAELRRNLPGIKIVQVIHITDESSVAEAVRLAGEVDGFLPDSGNQTAAVKLLGGTGKTHDWKISRAIVDRVSVPVFLAGGLKPTTVGQAVRDVNPFGVDVCTGLRTDGGLDEQKLAAFARAIA